MVRPVSSVRFRQGAPSVISQEPGLFAHLKHSSGVVPVPPRENVPACWPKTCLPAGQRCLGAATMRDRYRSLDKARRIPHGVSITRRNVIAFDHDTGPDAPSPSLVAQDGGDGRRQRRPGCPGDRARRTGGPRRAGIQGERRCHARRAVRADAHRRLRTVGRDGALRDHERHGDELRLHGHKKVRPRDALFLHRPVE